MGRTVGTNLLADAQNAIQSVRYLLEIEAAATLNLATGTDINNVDISFDSKTWISNRIEVRNIVWRGAMANSFQVVWPGIRPGGLSNTTAITANSAVTLYQTAALSSYVGSNDVVKIYDGVVNGAWSLVNRALTLQVVDTMEWGPPWAVSDLYGFDDMTKPGVYRLGDVVMVLGR